MSDDITEAPPGQERLQEILLSYVEAAELGSAPERQAFVSEHPEFADDIAEFLASYDQIHDLVTPLREHEARVCEARGSGLPGMPATRRLHVTNQTRATEGLGVREHAAGEETATSALGQLGDYRLLREIGRG